jgi:hypothetical protein
MKLKKHKLKKKKKNQVDPSESPKPRLISKLETHETLDSAQ